MNADNKRTDVFKTFVFQQVQQGFWGSTLLPKQISIKAVNEAEAWIKIKLRSDFCRKLRNGDMLSWTLVTSPVLLDQLVDKIVPNKDQ